jgi:hypothetical protein
MEERLAAILEARTDGQRGLPAMMQSARQGDTRPSQAGSLSLSSSLASSVNTKGRIKADEYRGEKHKLDA